MTTKIRIRIVSAFLVGDLLEWLQENVGNLLWSKPIIEWHGQGWHITREVSKGREVEYVITVDDPKLAMLAILRWS